MSYFFAIFIVSAFLAILAATFVASVVGGSSFPLPCADRRIGCIDGLRGYLALSVLIHHFYIWIQTIQPGGSWERPTIFFINQLGAGAVGLFFMTTGLVFYPKILAGFTATFWPSVYVTRFFRIVPLVTVSVAAVTIVIMVRTGANPHLGYIGDALMWITTWSQVDLLGYKESWRINGVLWSLWYEWLFYIFILPVCAIAMDLIRGRLPSWCVPIALFAIGTTGKIVGPIIGIRMSLMNYLPLFAMGMIAYEVRNFESARRILSGSAASIIAAALLIAAMIMTPVPYGSALPCFGFFFITIACGNNLLGVFNTRGSLILGDISFSIYILHCIFLSVIFEDFIYFPAISRDLLPIILPFIAIVIVLITMGTYLFIERPMMALGKILANKLTDRRAQLDSRQLEVAP